MTDDTDNKVDFYNEVARKKLGVGNDWRWCSLEAVGPSDVVVTGGVPRMLKSGPRKGQMTWCDAELSKCVVTAAELGDARLDYEKTTGNCHECLGEGRVVWGVSSVDGPKYKTCRRCDGSRLAKNVAV